MTAAAARGQRKRDEEIFMGLVIEMATWLGIKHQHQRISVGSVPGWPDLALCGKRGFVLRECKLDGEDPTPEQAEWGAWLTRAGVDWAVWRPADLASGQIYAELRRIR